VSLNGRQVVVLAEDLYQELELWYPVLRMREAGARVIIAGTGSKSTYTSEKGYPVTVDTTVDNVDARDVDAVIVPGGYAPDKLRRYDSVLKLVRDAHDQGKIVAAVCHAGWVPISAGIVSGKTATCTRAIRDDLINAGAHYVDEEVVVDGNFITSRSPSDLPAFCREIIAAVEAAAKVPMGAGAR
jgi:protease I